MRPASRHRVARSAWALCLVALVTTMASAQEPVGRVAAVEGTADMQHAGAGDRVLLAAGDTVGVGDHLRTAADGKLRVVLRDESILTLGSACELVVTEQLLMPTPVSRFELLLGTMRALVGERYSRPGARFEVETPTAVAGVRGTSFIAAYDPTRDETMVAGLEDLTRVRARVDEEGSAEVVVGPGTATWVRRGRRPLAPVALGEDQLRLLRGATELGASAGTGARRNAVDARRPHRAGESAFSREERAVDQPLFGSGQSKPPPPPPPVPRRAR